MGCKSHFELHTECCANHTETELSDITDLYYGMNFPDDIATA